MRFWCDTSSLLLGKTIIPGEWEFIVKACTNQMDGKSCGAFVCSNMYMVCTGNYKLRYPNQWQGMFKKFMLHCLRTPYVFQMQDLCPVCGNWCNPHQHNTIKCISCCTPLHITCAKVPSNEANDKSFQYICKHYFRTNSWCHEIKTDLPN